jgi:phenylacetate-CoA ligase
LIFNKEMETMAPQELKNLQLNRLQYTVDRVYANVDFYQEKFKELGITPEDIQSLEDISKLPFTKKQDLRDHYPFGMFASQLKDIVRLHASSGTSGKPTVVGYSKNDIENWSDMIARCIAAAGGEPGDIFHNAYGYGLFTGGLGLHYGAEKLGVTTVPVSGGNTARQMLLIEDFKPRGIGGTPSYILNIAEQMEEMGIDPKETSIEYGIFGAEPWSEEMRKTIEGKLGIKAVDIYGLSEIMGPGVSVECHEAQEGLHIAEDHFYVEVINPDTLEPVADGEEGELVFTSLTKEAFPILRYRTGDISSITRGKCICGRTTARMTRVKGRIDDMLIIRGVNVFPSEIEKCLLELEELAPHYQLHITKDGHMDKIELNVEITGDVFKGIEQDISHEFIGKIKGKVQKVIKEQCLVSMNVYIQPPKSIPRSEGKAVRIVDDRN